MMMMMMMNKLLRMFKGCPPKKENALSFWAILFSTILYITIFALFNIHLSTIISTTRFWFLISNTLVLIIAADFGDFSTSIHQGGDFDEDGDADLYQDCLIKTTHARINTTTPHYGMKRQKNPPQQEKERDDDEEMIEETLKDVVVVQRVATQEAGAGFIPPCCYSGDGKAIRPVQKEEERRILLQRSKSERHEPPAAAGPGEESEFSSMSVEELNRRVEEFIERFNNQMRLRAARIRQNSKFHQEHRI